MTWLKGWSIAHLGIALLSIGTTLHYGIDIGLITAGIALICAGLTQVLFNDSQRIHRKNTPWL